MHTEGYQDIIVLRWSLRSESDAHCTLKDIEMLLSLSGLSEVIITNTEGY